MGAPWAGVRQLARVVLLPGNKAPTAACHILECCEGLAQSVISTVGQAFELRFKQYLHSPPTAVVPPERYRPPSSHPPGDHTRQTTAGCRVPALRPPSVPRPGHMAQPPGLPLLVCKNRIRIASPS